MIIREQKIFSRIMKWDTGGGTIGATVSPKRSTP